MYVHQTVGPSQKPGSITLRQRHLSDLMAVCSLSREFSGREPQEALLDRIVRHAAELAPVAFSKVLTCEPDGSYVCRAIYQDYPTNDAFRKNQPVPRAAWPIYTRACQNGKRPVAIRQQDPKLSEEERIALGLKTARRVWLVPLCDGTENIGIFILGERSNGSPKDAGAQRMEMITGIAEQASVVIQHARRNTHLEETFINIILALAEAIDSADPDSYNHGHRTANLALAIARQFNFSEEEFQHIRWASLLHDIGKVGISEGILRKPGPLSEAEWEIMRQHPVIGADMLQPVPSLHRVADIVRSHHERYDGSGYPYGLSGDQIPLAARILAVADAYSVMIQGRVYREAITQAQAIAELKRCAGTDFDPQVVIELIALIQQGRVV